MKIAFLGDSITEGVPGVSFVKLLEQRYQNHEFINYGKGGDTISSLYKRIHKIPNLDQFDAIVLFVGVNDLFGKLTCMYRIIKTLMRQRWAKNIDVFQKQYQDTLEFLLTKASRIIVIPPLLIGEDIHNKWNTTLSKYVQTIESLLTTYPSIEYLDIRKQVLDYLKDKTISDFIPSNVFELLQDVRELHSDLEVDERSQARGLHLTLDGVHINSIGATILSDGIQNILDL